MHIRFARRIAFLSSVSALVLTVGVAAQQPQAAAQSTAAPNLNAGVSPETSPNPQPMVVRELPGASNARLVSRRDYVSPFAALLGANRPASTSQDVSRFYRSRGRFDLSRVPEMFGDFRSSGFGLSVVNPADGTVGTKISTAAGIGGLRIAEDNQALPRNRWWVGYNHFHNAFDTSSSSVAGPLSQSTSLNRFVLGSEWLLDEGQTSVEVRMAFGSAININGRTDPGNPGTAYAIESDSVGNLSVILKRLLFADACSAWSAGLGIETPTGSSGSMTFIDERYRLDPEAVHLLPFLAYTERNGRWFGNAFSQLDVAVGGDSLLANSGGATPLVEVGKVNAAPLLGIDIGLGYWLIQSCRGRGVAAVTELHSTTALDNDDVFTVATAANTLNVNSPIGVSNNLLNWTSGLVVAGGGGWSLRGAVAVPLLNERVFDTELLVQLNRSF